MKKILSLALVLLMVVGVAAPAFAAVTVPANTAAKYFVSDEDVVFAPGASGSATSGTAVGTGLTTSATYVWNTKTERYEKETTLASDLKAGAKVAIEIKAVEIKEPTAGSGTFTANIIDHDDVKKDDINKFKAFFDSARGSFAEGPTVASVKVYETVGTTTTSKYIWAVLVKLPDTNTATVDISGNIAIAKTKTAAKDSKVFFGWGTGAKYEEMIGINGSYTYNKDTNAVILNVNDDDTDIDIEFGDDARYEVNASGQGKVNVKYNTKFNSEFAALYPNANIDFLTFEKTPSFNRTGTLYVKADADTFIYAVTADGAKEIDAVYDADEDAWKIKTRTLGAYAISDVELKVAEVAPEVAPEVEAPEATVKPNPSTGR